MSASKRGTLRIFALCCALAGSTAAVAGSPALVHAEDHAAVPSERLVEWQAGDGWEPICTALGVPVPEAAFPHANTTDEFRAMVGLD